MSNFLAKAKAVLAKWWRWILGGFIALAVVFTVWRLRRQAAEIDRLRADVAKSQELVKDLQTRIRAEENAALARALQEEVERIQADIAGREARIKEMEKQYDEAKKKVDAAKNWKDLDDQARPR